MKCSSLIAPALAVLGVFGCSPDANQKELVRDNVVRSNDLQRAPNSVLIRCNGRELTFATFNRLVALRKRVMVMSSPSEAKITVDGLSMVDGMMLRSITNAFPREAVLLDYADKNHILPDERSIEMCRKGFLKSCKMQGRKWANATKKFSKDELNTIVDRIRIESTAMAVRQHYLKTNPVVATDEEVEEFKTKFADYNRRCAETNAMIWAQASNLWKRVVNGESFEKLAAKYDEDESRSPTGEWGDFAYSDLEGEINMVRASRKFKPGYVTPPIEGDNGLMIVKVNAIGDPLEDPHAEGYVPSPEATFTLSRIFLHLPEFIEDINPSTFKQQVQEAKANVEFEMFVKKALQEAQLDFPSGVEIFKGDQKGGGNLKVR